MSRYRIVEKYIGKFLIQRRGPFGWFNCDLDRKRHVPLTPDPPHMYVSEEEAMIALVLALAAEAHSPRVVFDTIANINPPKGG